MKRIYTIILAVFFLFLAAQSWANPVRDKFNEAMIAYRSGDYEKSIQLFEETIELNHTFPQPYNFMAMAKKQLGADSEEIISLLEKAVEIDPNFAMAYDNLGKEYYGMGKFEEAKTSASRAVEIDPNLITAKLSLGWICLLGFGETREAIDHFESAIAQQKTDYAVFGLGMAYFMDHQRGKVLDMITTLRQEGNDKLAEDLEEMIRSGRYLPPKGVHGLINPVEQEVTEVKKPSEDNVEFPVRLSGSLNQPINTPQMRAPADSYPTAMSGQERIRQLQRNYSNKGSGY